MGSIEETLKLVQQHRTGQQGGDEKPGKQGGAEWPSLVKIYQRQSNIDYGTAFLECLKLFPNEHRRYLQKHNPNRKI